MNRINDVLQDLKENFETRVELKALLENSTNGLYVVYVSSSNYASIAGEQMRRTAQKNWSRGIAVRENTAQRAFTIVGNKIVPPYYYEIDMRLVRRKEARTLASLWDALVVIFLLAFALLMFYMSRVYFQKII
jgi:hypothetical protein